MIETFDNALETKKFQAYAEKADTAEKRIELCLKYLKAKNIDIMQVKPDQSSVKDHFQQPLDISRYAPPMNIVNLYAQHSEDMHVMNRGKDYMNHLTMSVNGELLNNIRDQMVRKQVVKFSTMVDPATYQYRFTAKVGVAVER